jgi:hypothetical protein
VVAFHPGGSAKAGTLPSAASASGKIGGPEPVEATEPEVADVDARDVAADSAPAGGLGGDLIETPCFEYRAPTLLQNVSTSEETAGCITEAKATVRTTVDGKTTESLWGEVLATSIVLDGGLPPDADTAFETAWAAYFHDDPTTGANPREAVSLDGAPAELAWIEKAGATLDMAVLMAHPAHPYAVDGLESQVILVEVIAPKDSGDDYVRQVLDTWRWN